MGKIIQFQKEQRNSIRENTVTKRELPYKGTFDYPLIVAFVLLICIGLIMVFSSSYYAAEFRTTASGNATQFFFKQLLCVGIGAALMIFFMFFDYHRFLQFNKVKNEKNAHGLSKIKPYWIVLIATVLVLLLVWVPGIGQEINGSRRWIKLGISFQPSELLKFGVIIFMACSIAKHQKKMVFFKVGILPYLLLLLVISIPIFLQPNFSAILCIAALIIIMMLVGGCRLSHLLLICLAGGILLYFLAFAESYRADRIADLSDPLQDWQTKQSLFSIGTGGLFGKGLGNSLQKMLWLPMSESDFIFAIIAEELGFVGAVFVLLVYGFIIWRGVIIAMRAADVLGLMLATGTVAMLAIQVVINVAVVTATIPTTGIVLPFISYGGSSVIVFMMLMGILLNVSKQAKKNIKLRPAASKTKEGRKPNKAITGVSKEDWDL